MRESVCKSCVYSKIPSSYSGRSQKVECHRHSPTPIKMGGEHQPEHWVGKWPLVEFNDTCGEGSWNSL